MPERRNDEMIKIADFIFRNWRIFALVYAIGGTVVFILSLVFMRLLAKWADYDKENFPDFDYDYPPGRLEEYRKSDNCIAFSFGFMRRIMAGDSACIFRSAIFDGNRGALPFAYGTFSGRRFRGGRKRGCA